MIKKQLHKTVLTMGNFDGVHLGHLSLIKFVVAQSSEQEGNAVLVTFTPHPREILTGQRHRCLTVDADKIRLINDAGIKEIKVIGFTRDLSMLSPSEFLQSHIFSDFDVSHFIIGHDFSFGTRRNGDAHYMEEYCRKHKIKFTIKITPNLFYKFFKYNSVKFCAPNAISLLLPIK